MRPAKVAERDRKEEIMNRKSIGGLAVAGILAVGAPAFAASQSAADRASVDAEVHARLVPRDEDRWKVRVATKRPSRRR